MSATQEQRERVRRLIAVPEEAKRKADRFGPLSAGVIAETEADAAALRAVLADSEYLAVLVADA